MTALPPVATKQHLDEILDDPKQSLVELAALVDTVNQLIGMVNGLVGSSGVKAASIGELGLKALATKDTVSGSEIDDRAIALAKMALGTKGALYGIGADEAPFLIPPATAGWSLKSNGPDLPPTYQEESGVVVARAHYAYSSNLAIYAVIAFDQTDPLITEGRELFSINYTPKASTNRIAIRVNIPVIGANSTAANDLGIVSVFRDSDCLAVGTSSYPDSADKLASGVSFIAEDYHRSVTPRVYSVRMGVTAGRMYTNSNNGGTKMFNGKAKYSIEILEYSE